MTELFSWLPTGGWERLAADALWQSTAILTGALLAGAIVRRRPALRAAILLSAAALSLAVPLLSCLVRSGGGGLLSPPERGGEQQRFVVETQSFDDGATRTLDSARPMRHKAAQTRANLVAADRPIALRPWLVGCWLAASGYLALRLVRGIFAVRRWIRLASPYHDRKIEAALARASQAVGVQPPELLWSSAFDSPALVMLGRARLLLPTEMPEKVDWFAVFCHELAHRARRDGPGRLCVELTMIVLPWQPLLWLVRRRFRAACEEACDDWAVAAGADPVEFASLLVALVPERRPAFALGMAESPAATRHRILRLLAMQSPVSPQLGLVAGVAGWVVAIGLAIILAMLQYGSGPRPTGPIRLAPAQRALRDDEAKTRTLRESDTNQSAAPPWGNTPLADAVARAAAELPKSDGQQAPYVIEPPDVLLIDVVKLVPKSPYHIEPLDKLQVLVANPLIDLPISGQFSVDLSGAVDLGPAYGKISVGGKTIEEALDAIKKDLSNVLRDPQVSVSLSQTSGQQQIGREHLVGPDGTVNLGTYGTVYVRGMTIAQAKAAVEAQLSTYLEQPRVSIDVFAYNSKVYYVVAEGLSKGDAIVRFPITGNETVLDALAQREGKSPKLSDCWVWVARTMADNKIVILPVDLPAVLAGKSTESNWKIEPGDRIFVRPIFASGSDSAPIGNQSRLGSDSVRIRRSLAEGELEVLTGSRSNAKARLRDLQQQIRVIEERRKTSAPATTVPSDKVDAELAKDPVIADFTKRLYDLRLAIKDQQNLPERSGEQSVSMLKNQLSNLADEIDRRKAELRHAVVARLSNAAPKFDADLRMLEAERAALEESLTVLNDEINGQLKDLEKLGNAASDTPNH